MSIKLCYFYHPETGEYEGSEVIIPCKNYESSTTQPPSLTGIYEKARWTGKKWEIIPDFRKAKLWNKKSGERATVSAPGKLPPDLTDKTPPMNLWPVKFNTKKGEWSFDKKRWLDEYVRVKRDGLLKETDKFMTPDFPISSEKREKLKAYRQELRDLCSKINQEKEEWPESPMSGL